MFSFLRLMPGPACGGGCIWSGIWREPGAVARVGSAPGLSGPLDPRFPVETGSKMGPESHEGWPGRAGHEGTAGHSTQATSALQEDGLLKHLPPALMTP